MNLMEFLKIETVHITKEEVYLTLDITQEHKQPYGIMHGGISAVLAETAASMGANAYLDNTKEVAVGLELNVNHLRAVPNGVIHAYATPLHIGRKTHVWEIKLFHSNDQLASAGRCTLLVQPLQS